MYETKSAQPGGWVRRRPLRTLAVFAFLLLSAVLASPWIISSTGLKDELINRIIDAAHLEASTGDVALGWLSPVKVSNLELHGKGKRLHVEVDHIEADRSWLRLMADAPNLGKFNIERPRIRINLPLAHTEIPMSQLSPNFSAAIKDAKLVVCFDERNESIIEIDHINATVHIHQENRGGVMVMDPVQLFVQRELKPENCSQLLHLMSPAMRYATHTEGTYSLALDSVRIPMGVDREQFLRTIEIAGELLLHQVTLDSESPLLQALSRLVADVYGLTAPEKTRMIKDCQIRFEVRDGRLYHDGLKFGFPDIDPALEITSSGSVGLDESLDLCLTFPRLDKQKQQESGPVRCRISGTIDHPVLFAEDASLVLRIPGQEQVLLNVDDVDLTARVADTKDGRSLVFEPFVALNHQQIRRGTAAGILSLLDPGIDYSPDLTGEVSLDIDSLRVPLGVPDDELMTVVEASGQVAIHDATSVVSTPLRHAIIKILADLHGKDVSEVVRIAHDTTVDFEICDGRLHFDGLQIGFPDINPAFEISCLGSVGMDESLDVYFQVPRLNETRHQQQGPVHCHLIGTVKDPQLLIKDASLLVQLPNRGEPLLDFNHVDFSMRVVDTSNGRALLVDAGEVLKRQPINRRLASSLLSMVDPEIRYSPELTGEVSLSISRLLLPIDVSDEEFLKQIQMSGKLSIHEVNSIATSPLRHALIKLLADLYGTTAGDAVRVAHDTKVEFELRDGRFQFEGLQIGFPDIAPDLQITASGSIGLDESLDLQLQLPRLGETAGQNETPVLGHVTGTFAEPSVEVTNASLKIHLLDDPDATLSVDGVDFQFGIERIEDSTFITFEPFALLERIELTPDICDGLLTLVAPSLDEVADLSGYVSLAIDELRLPLADKQEIINGTVIVGKLQLHDIKATAQTPLAINLVKILFDQYGKEPQGSFQITKDATISFELKDHRIYHEDFRFGLPEISTELVGTSRGSVGLDKTLDLVLEVPRFTTVGAAIPEVDPTHPVRFRVTGTMEHPVVVEIKN